MVCRSRPTYAFPVKIYLQKITKTDPDYIEQIYKRTQGIHERVNKAQANLRKILASINKWGSKPLFHRKSHSTNLLLDIQNRDYSLNRRLKKCIETKRLIDRIMMDTNFRLFFNIEFSCPCSSDEETDEEPSPSTSGMISQRAQTVGFTDDDLQKLRQDVPVHVNKSKQQMTLYRAYEEYVDAEVGKALMAAIHKR